MLLKEGALSSAADTLKAVELVSALGAPSVGEEQMRGAFVSENSLAPCFEEKAVAKPVPDCPQNAFKESAPPE